MSSVSGSRDPVKFMESRKGKVNLYLEKYFDEIYSEVKDREMSKIVDLLRTYTVRGGKRVRPILVAAGYQFFGGKSDDIYGAAISIEISQSFFLIHDDIMDRSDLRRGFRSFHREIEELIGNVRDREHIAESLAIVGGDLAVDYSFDAILRSGIDDERKLKAVRELVDIIKITGYGEGLDVYSGTGYRLTTSDLIRLHLRKTAKYTIEGPLIMGARIAGNDDPLWDLKAYGSLVGIAFQLHDDVIGLFGTEKEIGKPPKSDVNEGKQTLLMIEAMKRSDPADRDFIWKTLTSGNVSDNDFEKLKRIVEDTGSLDYSRWLINRFIELGKEKLSRVDGDPEVKDFLRWFADYLVSRKN
ncbi:MAG: polyprenyl synthetase family protein [Candidatus Thermoplasmatota archaeon]|nr:polyprenyl synthetase family protein [Candidatus Thermoplasmatota archaeon]MCL5791099.1 polyprenyl synthetase family protein [Candidatus Thermoplasmatota archaeon]